MTEIHACSLFSGLQGEELQRAMAFFNAHEVTCRKKEILHRPGERLPFFGLVRTGLIEVSIDDYEGRHIIMAMVEPGGVFGESLCYLGEPSAVGIEAREETTLLLMNTDRLKAPLQADWEYGLFSRFTAMLAENTLRMNDRIQVLSMPTLRKKILLYLSLHAARRNSRSVNLAVDRSGMAAFLGADRTALSRELTAMQKDCLIAVDKNRFILL